MIIMRILQIIKLGKRIVYKKAKKSRKIIVILNDGRLELNKYNSCFSLFFSFFSFFFSLKLSINTTKIIEYKEGSEI